MSKIYDLFSINKTSAANELTHVAAEKEALIMILTR